MRLAAIGEAIPRGFRHEVAQRIAVAVAAEATVDRAGEVGFAALAGAITTGGGAILGTDLGVFARFASSVAALIGLAIGGAIDGILPRFTRSIATRRGFAILGTDLRILAAKASFAQSVAARPAAVRRALDRPLSRVAHVVAALGAIRRARPRPFLPSFPTPLVLADSVAADAAVLGTDLFGFSTTGVTEAVAAGAGFSEGLGFRDEVLSGQGFRRHIPRRIGGGGWRATGARSKKNRQYPLFRDSHRSLHPAWSHAPV